MGERLLADEPGVRFDGVAGVGGDHVPGQGVVAVQAAQQRREFRDLVRSCRVLVYAASVAAVFCDQAVWSPWRGMKVARFLGQHVGDEQLRRRARLIQNLMQTAGPLVGVAATAVGSVYAGLKGILN